MFANMKCQGAAHVVGLVIANVMEYIHEYYPSFNNPNLGSFCRFCRPSPNSFSQRPPAARPQFSTRKTHASTMGALYRNIRSLYPVASRARAAGFGTTCYAVRESAEVVAVSRRIEKPEDAIPLILERRVGNLPFETEEVKAFTAAECAQIAKHYAEIQSELVQNVHTSGMNKAEEKRFTAESDAWEAAFYVWLSNEIDTASNTGKVDK